MDLEARRVVRIGIPRGEAYPMGPGKASLLEAIAQFGSISSAARSLNLSYRKAWTMVDTMNRHFRQPLVHATTGGVQGGGAQITEAGMEALRQYRELERQAWEAIEEGIRQYRKLLKSNDLQTL